jgi:predicted transcriptional regulator
MAETTKKRARPVGRPRIHGKRTPLGLRVTKELKQRLDEAAKASGRSQSQEAELRLEKTFEAQNAVFDALDLWLGRRLTGLVLAIAQTAQITGTRSRAISGWDYFATEAWPDDPYAYDQVVQGITYLLEQFRPKGNVKLRPQARSQFAFLPEQSLYQMGEGFAENLLATREQRNNLRVPDMIADAIWKRLDTRDD